MPSALCVTLVFFVFQNTLRPKIEGCLGAIYDAMTGGKGLFVNKYYCSIAVDCVPLAFNPSFTLQVFIVNDLTHGFCIHFTFHPRYNIEVSKGTGFKAVFFQVFDFL